ncbi:zinc finger C2HC domain-containing protein 1A-like isoform X2 [Centruroides vittatus]|uniref:zinc finger C2HC domain-containing protein 1A-like isoform X2 n=1 Tax=Centruroides vittatus TaxID=120091 RepID=UPI00350F557E
MDNLSSDENAESVNSCLKPCSICGRTFRPDALERHEGICKKTSLKKRKIFDSSKQRAEGTEIKSVPTTTNVKKDIKPKKSNWRDKHEEFVKNIRMAKGEVSEETSQPKKNIPSDYIQCPSCNRHFNQKAAERHISWCQSQSNIPKSSVSKEAKERLQARTKYRAPLPGKKGTDKSSPKSAFRRKTASNEEQVISENKVNKAKSREVDSNRNYMKSGKQQTGRVSSERSDIKSRESTGSQNSIGSQSQVVKFKDKFPNRNIKKSPESDDGYSSLNHVSSHLQDILHSKGIDNRSPRTVPGVRTGGLDSSGNWGQSHNGDVINEEEYGVLQRLVDLNSSIASTGGYGDLNNSWNKLMFPSNSNLPEVSSCDGPTQGWPSRSCWGSNSNTPLSSSSSISSLSTGTSGSRGGSSENILPLFCSHCGSKYPVAAAKYCCECGAKRKGFGNTALKTELIGC